MQKSESEASCGGQRGFGCRGTITEGLGFTWEGAVGGDSELDSCLRIPCVAPIRTVTSCPKRGGKCAQLRQWAVIVQLQAADPAPLNRAVAWRDQRIAMLTWPRAIAGGNCSCCKHRQTSPSDDTPSPSVAQQAAGPGPFDLLTKLEQLLVHYVWFLDCSHTLNNSALCFARAGITLADHSRCRCRLRRFQPSCLAHFDCRRRELSVMSTSSVVAQARSTPVKQTTPAATESPGNWRHPRLAEIAQRQSRSTFSERNIRQVVYNAVAIVGVLVLHQVLMPWLSPLL